MTIQFLLTCAFIATIVGVGADDTSLENVTYSVESNDVPEEWKYSFFVPIVYYKVKVECTGALISQFHILVSPLCFSHFDNNKLITNSTGYRACVGSEPWGKNFRIYDIKELDVHPEFSMDPSSFKISNAIAVALLDRNDELTFKVLIAPLATGTLNEQAKIVAFGFRSFTGRVFYNPFSILKKRLIKFTEFKMAKWSECKSYMRRFMKIEKKQICTKRLIAYHQGSLPGDILVDHYDILGLQIRDVLTHSVFTDVRAYSAYIKNAKEKLLRFRRTENEIAC